MARKYELKTRADRQEATRRRIVEAVMALHEEIGPARTTVSAIAERAGVERLTVYRHFANEQEIVDACSTRFDELHPLPDLSAWEAIDDPFERLTQALSELYRYYADTEQMTTAVLRDAPTTPALHAPLARYQQGFHDMVVLLVTGFAESVVMAERVQLPILLATDFRIWQIMVREQGMDISEAVAYQLQIVRCAVN